MSRLTLALLGLSVAAVGCSQQEPMPGAATARIAQVPNSVLCVQITVADANHFVQRNFDVMPNAPALLQLQGLPVGAETFSGAAFPAGCSAIGGLAPTWIADPTTAYLTAGTVTPVTLIMRKAGGADVDVQFDDGDGGTGDGGVGDGGGPPDLSQPGHIIANPPVVDFGNPSQPSDFSRTVMLVNVGPAPVTFFFTFQGPFTLGNNTTDPMACTGMGQLFPGQQCSATIVFTPPTVGEFGGQLVVQTGEPAPTFVSLHGIKAP
jgi:hypothetical protein